MQAYIQSNCEQDQRTEYSEVLLQRDRDVSKGR